MTPTDIQDHRVQRLQQLLDQKFHGKKVELGRALGHKTGAFVRQLLDRERPITEKTVSAIHALPGCHGWMDIPLDQVIPTKLDGFKATFNFEAIDGQMRKHVTVEEGKFYFTNPASGDKIELLPERQFSLGGSSKVISDSMRNLPVARRKTIANLMAEQMVEGPSADLSSQIDDLAPGAMVSLSMPWRAAAMVLFDSLKRDGRIDALTGEAFAALVDHIVATDATQK